jgi:hypothetical protein
MQKWEYARINFWYGEKQGSVGLTYYHPAGTTTDVFDEKSPISNYVKRRDAWITRLGQEGYEMVGITALGSNQYPQTLYWFKRPS